MNWLVSFSLNVAEILHDNIEWVFSGVGLAALQIAASKAPIVKTFLRKHITPTYFTGLAFVALFGVLIIAYRGYSCNFTPIKLASGPEGGTFSAFASDLRNSLIQDSILVFENNTQGSIENLNKLGSGYVGLALCHTGLHKNDFLASPDSSKIKTVAHIYDSKLYIAARKDVLLSKMIKTADDIASHQDGLTIYAGGEYSGTRSVVEQMLPEIKKERFAYGKLSFTSAAIWLLKQKIDIAFFLVEGHAPVITEVLFDKNYKCADTDEVVLIGFDDAQRNTRDKPNGEFEVTNLDYGCKVSTVQVKEFLLASEDVPNNIILKTLDRMYNNTPNGPTILGPLSETPFVKHATFEYHDGAKLFFQKYSKSMSP